MFFEGLGTWDKRSCDYKYPYLCAMFYLTYSMVYVYAEQLVSVVPTGCYLDYKLTLR
jgi:hypothetical protein